MVSVFIRQPSKLCSKTMISMILAAVEKMVWLIGRQDASGSSGKLGERKA
jgi:hypothetical protein